MPLASYSATCFLPLGWMLLSLLLLLWRCKDAKCILKEGIIHIISQLFSILLPKSGSEILSLIFSMVPKATFLIIIFYTQRDYTCYY